MQEVSIRNVIYIKGAKGKKNRCSVLSVVVLRRLKNC